MPKKQINLGEHVFIAGGTGSGKSFLADVYSSMEASVVVHDTKGLFTWRAPHIVVSTMEELLDRQTESTHIIYRPIFQELELEYYDAFYQWVYERQNCVVVVDEAMQVCPSSSKYPQYLKGILTRGRERKTSAWVCTQRPKTLPLFLLSEAYHFFIFRLNLKADRERLIEITGQDEFLIRPDKYQFWYWNIYSQKPKLAILK